MITPEIAERFAEYHREHMAWGCLHIVLDDDNIEDEYIRYCIEFAKEHNDQEAVELGEILLKLTEEERVEIGNLK